MAVDQVVSWSSKRHTFELTAPRLGSLRTAAPEAGAYLQGRMQPQIRIQRWHLNAPAPLLVMVVPDSSFPDPVKSLPAVRRLKVVEEARRGVPE